MNIAVLGGGAFGTALAISLARKAPVTFWARQIGDMATTRENKRRLPGQPFPDALTVTENLADADSAEILLLALPMQKLRDMLNTNGIVFAGKNLVACCKGIELKTSRGPTGIIHETVPSATAAILTGPSFANDIAKGLPTALTLACQDENAGRRMQDALSTENLRLYRSQDTIGAELGGALKNVMAIACGAAMGAGLGESARAALMTRGFAEMQRLATHLGAQSGTLAGLSGFGDLTLTCTSTQSRNYQLGLSLGKGNNFDPSITVEGAATAQATDDLAHRIQLDMPITHAVAQLLKNKLDVTKAMQSLLNRPLKEE